MPSFHHAPIRQQLLPEVVTTLPCNGFDLEQHLERLRVEYLAEALIQTCGIQTKAAQLLGMSPRTFHYALQRVDVAALPLIARSAATDPSRARAEMRDYVTSRYGKSGWL